MLVIYLTPIHVKCFALILNIRKKLGNLEELRKTRKTVGHMMVYPSDHRIISHRPYIEGILEFSFILGFLGFRWFSPIFLSSFPYCSHYRPFINCYTGRETEKKLLEARRKTSISVPEVIEDTDSSSAG